jgi:hypothetical protein
MNQQGRFGKYGDLKRKDKIRQNRVAHLGRAGGADLQQRALDAKLQVRWDLKKKGNRKAAATPEETPPATQ